MSWYSQASLPKDGAAHSGLSFGPSHINHHSGNSLTGQSDGGDSSAEASSFQMILVSIKLTVKAIRHHVIFVLEPPLNTRGAHSNMIQRQLKKMNSVWHAIPAKMPKYAGAHHVCVCLINKDNWMQGQSFAKSKKVYKCQVCEETRAVRGSKKEHWRWTLSGPTWSSQGPFYIGTE